MNVQVAKSCMASQQRINYTDQLVTPSIAKHWLTYCNLRNRKLKKATSYLYAKQMTAGFWTKGSRIMFYQDGVLCDGQNRLAALVESGVSCSFDILVGASQEEGANVDIGAKRSAHDALQIKGVQDWIANKHCVALINSMHKFGSGCGAKDFRLSHQVIEQYASKNESWLKPFVRLSQGLHKRRLTSSSYYAQLAAAHFWGESLDELIDFHERLLSGENYDPQKNAVTRIREYLIEINGSPWAFPIAFDSAKRTQRAIKAFIDRQPLSKLYAPGEYIYKFPVVSVENNAWVPHYKSDGQ